MQMQPAPAPRFSRTVEKIQGPTPVMGRDTRRLLADAGYTEAEIDQLIATNAVAGPVEDK